MILKKNIEPGGNEGHGGLCQTELLTSSVEAAMELFIIKHQFFILFLLYACVMLLAKSFYLHHILSASV